MKCFDAELLEKLPEKYRDKLCFVGSDTGKRHEVIVEPEDIRDVLEAVRDSNYPQLVGITVIDYPDQGVFELVYMLTSIDKKGALVTVRTRIPRDNPVIDSVSDIYPLAYYQEIEAYEFFGITFKGHDGLRQWILEDNWMGPPPLRKDVDTRKIVLDLYYGGKRYERPVQERSLGGYSLEGGEQ